MSLYRSTRAHPRRCGDHEVLTLLGPLPGGSSPQVRGPQSSTTIVTCGNGLIPAGAGTTRQAQLGFALTGAHPRRCGDHLAMGWTEKIGRGSSPQVRGPLVTVMLPGIQMRLIPAGAGTTLLQPMPCLPDRAHPRRCGDHETQIFEGYFEQGSSPQVRGPRVAGHQQRPDLRLIPAGAGTTPRNP